MQLRTLIILIVTSALVTAGLVLLFVPSPTAIPPGSQTIPYLFAVGEFPGIDAGTDIFRLGQVTAGGTSWRTLSISPTLTSLTPDNRTVRRVRVWAQGEGAEWLTIDPSTLSLPGSVKITVHAPASAKQQQYRGVLVVQQLPPE